jgi:hypothetical protein
LDFPSFISIKVLFEKFCGFPFIELCSIHQSSS